jgi:hypothetical protein
MVPNPTHQPLGRCGRERVVDVSEIGSELRIGRRVVVTGMAGAGKSTFAQLLSAKTGLPVIHLDVYFWKPGWVEPSDTEWRDVQSTLLASEEWIADGNYHETLDLRLKRADTVVYLDTPWWLCAARAFVRGLVVQRVPGCLMAAKIRDGDGCVTNGGWCGASGWGEGLSASESWRSWRGMEAM